ncbi:MAG: P-II family nitrogen regulator [Lachnospiraceae bacterium]|nr:P-II family nitrogen regulator [Lachnospiraceae bacterium]
MKKLEIIIRPEKLDELKALLSGYPVKGLNIANVMGFGNQMGVIKKYHGAEYKVDLLPKVKVETVVENEDADELIEKIVAAITTGNAGDGKIFVLEVQEAVRIRTGERGQDAL